jgi:hypothetical protein
MTAARIVRPRGDQLDPRARMLAQRDARLRPNGLSREEPHAPPAGEGREHEDRLGPRELLADADARAAAEREVGELRAVWGGLAPPLGAKALGLRPPARVVVREPRRGHDAPPGLDLDVAEGDRLGADAADGVGRRVEPHGFGDDGARVRQRGEVLDAGRARRGAAAEDGCELVVQPALDVGVLGEEIPGPGERVRRRLVAGEEERHHLVAELGVAHRRAVGLVRVGREEEHRQQVAAGGGVGGAAALGDHAVDDRVEPVARAHEASEPRDGEAERPLGDVEERERGDAHRVVHGLGHVARTVGDVGAEQRLAGDAEGERGHLGREVDPALRGRQAGLPARDAVPAVAPALGGGGHGDGVAGDALAVEGGLRDTSLAAVELALAREEAVAEQEAEAAVGVAAHEVALMGHKYHARHGPDGRRSRRSGRRPGSSRRRRALG